MRATISPSPVSGKIHAPASKSSMQRACAAALLQEGKTILFNAGKSNDDLAALSVIRSLGAVIEVRPGNTIQITGNGISPVTNEINCGESGLGLRMFAPLAALSAQAITLNGRGSLLNRPMDFFDRIFPQLGIEIKSNNGKLPISITGPLQPKEITIDGSLSSQFLTGLLFAFGKAATVPVNIHVQDLKSKPYIDLTLEVMEHFGYKAAHRQHELFTIFPATRNHSTIEYTVEGDWSGGAFLLVAGALAGKLEISGLNNFSTQADKAILQALMASGANISVADSAITIAPPLTGISALKPFHFNATDCPDLFPPLVALAAHCNGTSVIEGVERLEHKESNRGVTLQEVFGKMGIGIKLQDNLMLVEGGTGVQPATVHSHHDHRIAMAAAVAGLPAKGNIVIEDAGAVDKSYPDFFEHLTMIGATILLS